MRTISTIGFEKPKSYCAGPAPKLQWLAITDLVIDSSCHPPMPTEGRRIVDRIARSFSWSCFVPVIVTPTEDGKFAIIDGQQRTTAASLVGFESVPCQIVIANHAEQAVAFKAINCSRVPSSRMSLHAEGVAEREKWAVKLVEICRRADVELLRYPVSIDRQSAGQTMAVGAIGRCLKLYGEDTLITALQCVTQTTNNRPGVLSARMIKALCVALAPDHARRDSGLALLEAFDAIDLVSFHSAATIESEITDMSPVNILSDKIRTELVRLIPDKASSHVGHCTALQSPNEGGGGITNKTTPPSKRTRQLQRT
jgi:hypothetical protein